MKNRWHWQNLKTMGVFVLPATNIAFIDREHPAMAALLSTGRIHCVGDFYRVQCDLLFSECDRLANCYDRGPMTRSRSKLANM